MANLYQIDQAIFECLDAETGEIIDPEKLEALYMERNQKIENVACWIKNLVNEAEGLKAQKEAFAERQKAAEKKIESLKAYLTNALMGEKFSTTKCAVSFRRSKKVEVSDESKIPAEFLKEVITYSPDKTAIKAAIEAGNEVSGCELVENLNPQIR